jgi:hypothetical protein
MTLAQFHAALKKKWPGLVTTDYVVYVDELCLTFLGDGDIRATVLCCEHKGYGPTLNTAILELQRSIKAEIRDDQEALKNIQEATCTRKSKTQSSRATTSPPHSSASKG